MISTKVIKVMHLVDSLAIGGTETVAVNLVNSLPQDRYQAYLCSTRRDGPLAAAVAAHVQRVSLRRKGRFDVRALRRLLRSLNEEKIDILHVHSSSLFLGRLTKFLTLRTGPRLVWHDHYGKCENGNRSIALYRLATSGIDGVIAVNSRLAEWSLRKLAIPQERVWYVPNFVVPTALSQTPNIQVPGVPGSRVVCVANLRPQKDHVTLIRAFKLVCDRKPKAHLLLVGSTHDETYGARLRSEVSAARLEEHITFIGPVQSAWPYLQSSDVAVLTSRSEGLPLALLEYAWAGLPTVATRVGQCPDVLDDGRVGILVDPGSPEQVADAIVALLDDHSARKITGQQFQQFVRKTYSQERVLDSICSIYELLFAEQENNRRAQNNAA